MTTTTYRALFRLRQASARLVAADHALRPQDAQALPAFVAILSGVAAWLARIMERRLDRVLSRAFVAKPKAKPEPVEEVTP